MAQTPATDDSPDLVARAAKRHLRLTKRTAHAEAMTLASTPARKFVHRCSVAPRSNFDR